jgi:anti-sigma regulatory factor (Ser/Thr protein kinase)
MDSHTSSFTLEIANQLPEIARVNQSFAAFATTHGLSERLVERLHVVFDELLNNVISYGYDDQQRHCIEVAVELRGTRLTVRISDDARAFDPFARAVPDTTLPIEERPIGGLGIHLVRKMMDEVGYERRDGRNVVTVVVTVAVDCVVSD